MQGLCRAYTPPPFAAAARADPYGGFGSLLSSGSSSSESSASSAEEEDDGGELQPEPEPEPEPETDRHSMGLFTYDNALVAALELQPERFGLAELAASSLTCRPAHTIALGVAQQIATELGLPLLNTAPYGALGLAPPGIFCRVAAVRVLCGLTVAVSPARAAMYAERQHGNDNGWFRGCARTEQL